MHDIEYFIYLDITNHKSLATQIFDAISCGPGKLDLSGSMCKKDALQLFPISDPYPAGIKR